MADDREQDRISDPSSVIDDLVAACATLDLPRLAPGCHVELADPVPPRRPRLDGHECQVEGEEAEVSLDRSTSRRRGGGLGLFARDLTGPQERGDLRVTGKILHAGPAVPAVRRPRGAHDVAVANAHIGRLPLLEHEKCPAVRAAARRREPQVVLWQRWHAGRPRRE